jgi:hypothetical protein
MRTFAVIFTAAAAISAFPAGAAASPQWCQAEVCTDPVGHFTKPAQPVFDALGIDPRP